MSCEQAGGWSGREDTCAGGAAPTLEVRIQRLIDNLPEGGVTLFQLRELAGQEGLLVLVILLTLVFLVPVSIPGVSTVFGGGILLVGICRSFGRMLWLPHALARRALPSARVRTALLGGAAWLCRAERVSRPGRLGRFADGRLADAVNNAALTAGALLLMAPFGFVPFSNTLPALALLLLAVGLLQRDGLYVLAGHVANLMTVAYFGALLLGGGAALRALARVCERWFAS